MLPHITSMHLLTYLIVIVYFLGFCAAIHAILTVRTAQSALAWGVSLFFMPHLTLIPYLIFGRSRFNAYIKSRRQADLKMQKTIQTLNWHPRTNKAMTPAQSKLYAKQKLLPKLLSMHCSTNNHVSLLLNGDNTFSAIFSAIQQAQKVILIQFYIVRDDKIGQELSCLLQKKAAEGVKIYFLYDAIGSHKLPENYIQYLRNADIQIFSFPAGRSILNKFQLNFRNHRKVVVIDGHTGFIGGHNVGDEYLGRKPPLAPWRDTHIKITGPVVTCLQESFAQDWFWSTKELPDMLPLTKCPKQEMLCQLITTGPADTEEAATLLLLDAASQAEHRLWISTPYFVIDDTVFSALKLAALRGIDVRILLPQKSDSWVVHAASMLYAFEALHSKIRVFRYQPGFIHQKIILIDEAIAVIGSANLDNRSIHLNFEIMLLTVDIQFAAEVSDMLEKDFKQANELSITDQKHIRRWQNLGMRIARLVSPIL